MTTTIFILAIMVAIPLGWEAYSIISQDVITISEGFNNLGQEWSPFTVYALSVLVGHFFVQPPREYTIAGNFPEVAEVLLVLWLGWAVFVAGKAFPGLLPLAWWEALFLIFASVLVGGFLWTIGV